MKFRIEHINFIEENDNGWDDGSNAGKALIWGPHTPDDVDPYTLQLFIEKGYTYQVKPTLLNSNHPDTIFEIEDSEMESNPTPYLTHDVKDFMISYEPEKQHAACANMIPANATSKTDAPVELYDYPFTAMPLTAMCIASERGGSPFKPVPCSYGDVSQSVAECSDYAPSITFEIGTVNEVPVTVTRMQKVNTYEMTDQSFHSYKSLLKWCEESDFDFKLTYVPEDKDSQSFYDGALERMAVTYGK